ncbi:hypothetical protein WJ972_16635 [Achromobacter insuavis]
MGIVRLGHHVGNGQLQLIDPQASRHRGGRQAVLFAEEQQDVGGLRQGHFPGHQIRRRERRLLAIGQHVLDQRIFANAGLRARSR